MSHLSVELGPEDIAPLTRRFHAQKSALSRQINLTNMLLETIHDTPSASALAELEDAKTKLNQGHGKIDEIVMDLLSIETIDVDEWNQKMEQESTRFGQVRQRILNIIGRQQPQVAVNQPNGQASQDSHAKPVDSLKPFDLTREHTPAEFDQWKQEFQSYYEASQFGKSSIQLQQAHFRKCIHPSLFARIRSQVMADTPIFGNTASCMSLLEEEFLQNYPIFTRRLRYSRSLQAPGQKFTDWTTELETISLGADLHAMTPDENKAMKYIAGCTDEKLRDKFLAVTSPTWQQLNQIAVEHEVSVASNQVIKEVDGSAKVAKTVSTYKKNTRQGNRNSHMNNSYSKDAVKPEMNKERARCFHCGSWKHKSEECERRDTLICRYCKQKGHTKFMCIQKQRQLKSKRPTKARASMVRFSKGANKPTPLMTVGVSADGIQPFKTKAMPDSGATRTLINTALAKKKGLKINTRHKEPIEAANSTGLLCDGSTTFTVEYQGTSTVINALVTSSMSDCMLIAWHDLQNLKVLSQNFPARTRKASAKSP